jgi:hypothetical protein
MKSKEEIEQLAKEYAKLLSIKINKTEFTEYAILDFSNGYTQCQEDMLILLRSEIKRAYQYGQTNAQMMEAGLERDEIEEYVSFRMLSFKNKQD